MLALLDLVITFQSGGGSWRFVVISLRKYRVVIHIVLSTILVMIVIVILLRVLNMFASVAQVGRFVCKHSIWEIAVLWH